MTIYINGIKVDNDAGMAYTVLGCYTIYHFVVFSDTFPVSGHPE